MWKYRTFPPPTWSICGLVGSACVVFPSSHGLCSIVDDDDVFEKTEVLEYIILHCVEIISDPYYKVIQVCLHLKETRFDSWAYIRGGGS